MKILVAAFAYNERKYLPYFVNYYRNQGCDILVLDNYSNDGTYEWLVKNNVHTGRVDTNGTFHLGILQTALMNEIKKINPDWVIYLGVDLFYYFDDNICKVIEEADKKGYNIIRTSAFSAYNTGEKFELPFDKKYFYVKKEKSYQMIAKYQKGFKIVADNISVSNHKRLESNGFFINYGMCKPAEEREETYRRRQKAWAEGLKPYWGTHYKRAHEIKWTWEKRLLIDIRTISEYKFIQQRQQILP
jgi:hypothetical protein